MNINKDIGELIERGIINDATAERIQEYYNLKENEQPNRLIVIFGVLGALLVGLGVILIVAHNWDQLTNGARTFLAFIPLMIGQLACGYTLFYNKESYAWREGSATFLFFAIAATMSIISQVYHLDGDLGSFVFTWMLLAIPIIYVMRSSMVSLMFIIGITYYGLTRPGSSSWYWLLLVSIIPYYIHLVRTKPKRNFTFFHHWLLPTSLIICLWTIGQDQAIFLVPCYISLFVTLYLFGKSEMFNNLPILSNGYSITGVLGTIVMLLTMTFRAPWEEYYRQLHDSSPSYTSIEFVIAIILFVVALGLLYRKMIKDKSATLLDPMCFVFIPLIIFLFLQPPFTIGVIAANILLLLMGIFYIRNGITSNRLALLNFGILMITALVISRFFDTNISFVIRGILFLLIGASFFAANYLMLKKRDTNGI